jgi:RNA polymerase sigma-70 factor (ECF subfamily)
MPEYNSTINLEEVLLRAKNGDKSAYAALYQEYSTPLYRFVYSRVNDKVDADDIVQDAFIRAFGAIDRFADQGKGMLPYLMTIARNLVINHAKKKKADTPGNDILELAEAGDRADSFALAGDDRALLAGALSVLSEIEKEVITLRFYAERSYGEIAEILDKREDAIRQHVARALRKMRSHLGEDTGELGLNLNEK